MAQIAVVYHSGYGHTQRLAQAVAAGAGAQLVAIDAEGNLPEGGWETLAAASAIIFGSPTYMAGPSWQFKKFADASSKPWFSQAWKDKLFAGFTNSASARGHGLRQALCMTVTRVVDNCDLCHEKTPVETRGGNDEREKN